MSQQASSAPRPLKTFGCHLVELNAALNLQPGKVSTEQSEVEKAAIKRSVLDYI